MTYLELVNAVLVRLREDTVTSLSNVDDNVVLLVMEFVNDAKRIVESAHAWNALQAEWTINTVNGTGEYSLTGAGKYARIESLYGGDNRVLEEKTKDYVRRNATAPSATPYYYTVYGQDANGDVKLKLHPTPNAAEAIKVYGHKATPDLSIGSDVLVVPHEPVVHYALALAAAERGEVGGQPSAELFAVANKFLSDAIALDGSMSVLDDIWMAV